MSEIQRYSVDCYGQLSQCKRGRVVLHADHLADRAELLRLLKEARQYPRHAACFIEKPKGIDYRCDWCKQVDALEGMK